MPCPPGTYLVNGICSTCPLNAENTPSGCQCKRGFIKNNGGSCVICSSLSNAFLINGFCAQCPHSQMTYNPTLKVCECPLGWNIKGGKCIQNCNPDELIDSNGTCYSCPRNMIPNNGTCVCSKGYVSNGLNCGCTISCTSSQFEYQGGCGQCPLNMIYNPTLKGCVCPQGYYWSNLLSVCEKSPIGPTNCPQSQYYDFTHKKCMNCIANCYSCNSSN